MSSAPNATFQNGGKPIAQPMYLVNSSGAPNATFQNGGKPIAQPFYFVDSNGAPITTANVKDYGAIGDGSTDDTNAIAAAITAATTAGGAAVSFPAGTYLSGNQTLSAQVYLQGAGIGATILKLKNGANVDLFSAQTGSINLAAAVNSGPVGTLNKFGIQGMTLDGNKANQTGGTSYPLRFYGYDFLLRDLEILNGYSGGILTDWNYGSGLPSPSDQMEAMLDTIKIHDCNGIGLQMGGPHDSRLQNILSFSNGSHNFHFAPNMNGPLCINCHGYLAPNTAGTCNFLIESASGSQFINGASDGAYYVGVAILGNSCSWQGQIYTSGSSANSVGVQLGQQAGQTPFTGQILQSGGVTTAKQVSGTVLNVAISGFVSAGIKAANETNSHILANIFQTSGTAISGTLSTDDDYYINVAGLTPDGTVAKSGGMQVVSSANHAFAVYDNAGAATFTVDSSTGGTSGFHVPGGIQFISGAGVSFNTSPNSSTSLLVNPGGDAITGLIIFPNSANQTAPLFATQSSSFGNMFTIDKSGNVLCLGTVGISTGPQSGVMLLIGANADSHNCLVLYPNSVNQSVPLLVVQNSSFADVFHVSKDGSIVSLSSLSVGQSASAAAIATSGTITTSGVGSARVAPTGAVTGIIMQAGTQAGQCCAVVNESAFTLTMAASGTSHVADGTSCVIAATKKMDFTWDSGTSLWYHN